jgi:hypothetical protein
MVSSKAASRWVVAPLGIFFFEAEFLMSASSTSRVALFQSSKVILTLRLKCLVPVDPTSSLNTVQNDVVFGRY